MHCPAKVFQKNEQELLDLCRFPWCWGVSRSRGRGDRICWLRRRSARQHSPSAVVAKTVLFQGADNPLALHFPFRRLFRITRLNIHELFQHVTQDCEGVAFRTHTTQEEPFLPLPIVGKRRRRTRRSRVQEERVEGRMGTSKKITNGGAEGPWQTNVFRHGGIVARRQAVDDIPE